VTAVCAYGGSRTGSRPAYAEAARELGVEVARRGAELVYGGGTIGLMGPLADGALAAGGRVVGVMPRALRDRERPHERLERLELVETSQERTRRMAELADALVALPGGFGVVAELFEAVTWRQTGLHAKPCAFLNTRGYYDQLLRQLDHACAEGLLSEDDRALLVVSDSPAALVEAIA